MTESHQHLLGFENTDPRFLCYVPSVLAAASMVLTLEEMGIWSTLEHQNDIMDIFKFDKVCFNSISFV